MTTLTSGAPPMTPDWERIALGHGLGIPAAIGGDLTPESVLNAHLRGVFCLPRSAPEDIADNEATYSPDVQAGDIPLLASTTNPYSTLWWSPPTRYVLPTSEVTLGRTVRRTIRAHHWTTSVNEDFEGVLEACRGSRKPRWITPALTDSLHVLHDQGWIHSIEVWEDNHLIGGLFGFALHKVFVMSSAFHTRPDAAKIAIADLARRTTAGSIRLLDAQVKTDYTLRLGARGIPRDEYQQWLTPAQPEPGRLTTGREHAGCLLPAPAPAALLPQPEHADGGHAVHQTQRNSQAEVSEAACLASSQPAHRKGQT
ncbi:leucyl/phenylalanyl-tRNA--protein transferase [Streptomyces sp. NPDC020875]|uniref:leucyl/phenylalanyl-tRNA--protein transferase n=1 Tax=Streptomyces sp. NPDC020875 TaxID=3154898 RepID=UPI0033E9B1FE